MNPTERLYLIETVSAFLRDSTKLELFLQELPFLNDETLNCVFDLVGKANTKSIEQLIKGQLLGEADE